MKTVGVMGLLDSIVNDGNQYQWHTIYSTVADIALNGHHHLCHYGRANTWFFD